MTRNKASFIGFGAVLLWSALAVLTVGTEPTPPFLLSGICFTIGGVIGVLWTLSSKGGFSQLRYVDWKVWVLGVVGIFGYHFFYFTALRHAPPAQAGLIAYLWPLLIVLFSGLLPNEKLNRFHIIGAAIAFLGAAMILGDGASGFSAQNWIGYAAAIICAFTWSGYSVLSRLAGNTPTQSVAVFCLVSALLSFMAHLGLEETLWPRGVNGWVSAIALGLGPVGAAFYFWDIGMKKGDIQILGIASYAAPLLSTFILVATGFAAASWNLMLATAFIASGAFIAAKSNN